MNLNFPFLTVAALPSVSTTDSGEATPLSNVGESEQAQFDFAKVLAKAQEAATPLPPARQQIGRSTPSTPTPPRAPTPQAAMPASPAWEEQILAFKVGLRSEIGSDMTSQTELAFADGADLVSEFQADMAADGQTIVQSTAQLVEQPAESPNESPNQTLAAQDAFDAQQALIAGIEIEVQQNTSAIEEDPRAELQSHEQQDKRDASDDDQPLADLPESPAAADIVLRSDLAPEPLREEAVALPDASFLAAHGDPFQLEAVEKRDSTLVGSSFETTGTNGHRTTPKIRVMPLPTGTHSLDLSRLPANDASDVHAPVPTSATSGQVASTDDADRAISSQPSLRADTSANRIPDALAGTVKNRAENRSSSTPVVNSPAATFATTSERASVQREDSRATDRADQASAAASVVSRADGENRLSTGVGEGEHLARELNKYPLEPEQASGRRASEASPMMMAQTPPDLRIGDRAVDDTGAVFLPPSPLSEVATDSSRAAGYTSSTPLESAGTTTFSAAMNAQAQPATAAADLASSQVAQAQGPAISAPQGLTSEPRLEPKLGLDPTASTSDSANRVESQIATSQKFAGEISRKISPTARQRIRPLHVAASPSHTSSLSSNGKAAVSSAGATSADSIEITTSHAAPLDQPAKSPPQTDRATVPSAAHERASAPPVDAIARNSTATPASEKQRAAQANASESAVVAAHLPVDFGQVDDRPLAATASPSQASQASQAVSPGRATGESRASSHPSSSSDQPPFDPQHQSNALDSLSTELASEAATLDGAEFSAFDGPRELPNLGLRPESSTPAATPGQVTHSEAIERIYDQMKQLTPLPAGGASFTVSDGGRGEIRVKIVPHENGYKIEITTEHAKLARSLAGDSQEMARALDLDPSQLTLDVVHEAAASQEFAGKEGRRQEEAPAQPNPDQRGAQPGSSQDRQSGQSRQDASAPTQEEWQSLGSQQPVRDSRLLDRVLGRVQNDQVAASTGSGRIDSLA